MRCFWGDESIWFFFELDDEGVVTRQIEPREPSGEALAAASLAEWCRAQDTRTLSEYEAVYGRTAELPYTELQGHDPQWLTADQFEAAWPDARRQRSGATGSGPLTPPP